MPRRKAAPATPLLPEKPQRCTAWLSPNAIQTELGTQTRTENQDIIDAYAVEMQEGRWNWEREPLPVIFETPDEALLLPGDGHHRVKAAIRIEGVSLLCEMRTGTIAEARLYSMSCESANVTHGLPLTSADKRAKIRMALTDLDVLAVLISRLSGGQRQVLEPLEEFIQRVGMPSDRAMAEFLAVSPPMIAKIRDELNAEAQLQVQLPALGSMFSPKKLDKKGRMLDTSGISAARKVKKSKFESLYCQGDILVNGQGKLVQVVQDSKLENQVEVVLVEPLKKDLTPAKFGLNGWFRVSEFEPYSQAQIYDQVRPEGTSEIEDGITIDITKAAKMMGGWKNLALFALQECELVEVCAVKEWLEDFLKAR